MEFYDKDGFVQLVPRFTKDDKKTEKAKPETIKSNKNPFKKGSWKAWLFKKAKKWKSSKLVSDFHFTKLENIVVYENDKPKVILSKTKIGKDKLKKLADKPNCYILINARDNVFVKLSIKSYLKLMKVNKMAITITVYGKDDGREDDPYIVYDDEMVLDNINDLMNWVNYLRQLINGVMSMQAQCCGYVWYDFKVKTVIIKTDGEPETYKGDFNEVMKAYNITPLL